jgi:Domain of unknown function (DUF1707)/Domain of unknown function (DUF4190)
MPHELRASDADREKCADRLRTASLEGRLDSDELEERLEAAYGARWCSELDHLVLDITPPPPAPAGPPVFVRADRRRRLNGFAVASLVSAVFFWWFGAVFAIAFGHLALSQIRRSGGTQSGRTVALAGLAIGYFEAASLLFVLLFALA